MEGGTKALQRASRGLSMITKPWTPPRPDMPSSDAPIELHVEGKQEKLCYPPALALALITRYIEHRMPVTATLYGADWIVYDGAIINLRQRAGDSEVGHLTCPAEIRAQLAALAEVFWQVSVQVDSAARQDERLKLAAEQELAKAPDAIVPS